MKWSSCLSRFCLSLLIAMFLLFAAPVLAHPMGNFSVNHITSISIHPSSVQIMMFIDLAEIPTAQEMKTLDADHDGKISPAEKAEYLKQLRLLDSQTLKVNGKPLPFVVHRLDAVPRGGAGGSGAAGAAGAGQQTMLLVADFKVDLHDLRDRNTLEYSDGSFEGRAGWKEMVAHGDGGVQIIESSVPQRSLYNLFSYPEDQKAAPPQVTSARIVFSVPSTPATMSAAESAAPAPPPGESQPAPRRTDPLSRLLPSGEQSSLLIVLAIPLAIVLGAFHALSPGHGKTVVAAYLVGSRGTPLHALLLGLVVTLTHTAGVFALGLVVLFASSRIIPERLYPWLGFVSGMMIFCVGSWQFIRRLSASYSATAGAIDPHGPGGHTHQLPDSISPFGLVALGVSGGIVPCPSALVLLLSAIALHRTGAGLVLIVAFSIGLAAVLILIGMLALYSQRLLTRWSWEAKLTSRLRVFSSLAVTLLGLGIAIQSLRAGALI